MYHINDIEEQYFKNLIAHTQSLKETADDLKAMHGIDCTWEVNATFPTEAQFIKMREDNAEISEHTWEKLWGVINKMEKRKAEAKVEDVKRNKELEILEAEYPTQFDDRGYAYRFIRDWEGRTHKQYIGM